MDLRLEVECKAESAIVAVFGEVDVYTAPGLDRCLQGLIKDGRNHVRLDLTGVSYLDSEGLKVLIRARNSLGQAGTISVGGAHGTVRRVLEISGLDRVFCAD